LLDIINIYWFKSNLRIKKFFAMQIYIAKGKIFNLMCKVWKATNQATKFYSGSWKNVFEKLNALFKARFSDCNTFFAFRFRFKSVEYDINTCFSQNFMAINVIYPLWTFYFWNTFRSSCHGILAFSSFFSKDDWKLLKVKMLSMVKKGILEKTPIFRKKCRISGKKWRWLYGNMQIFRKKMLNFQKK